MLLLVYLGCHHWSADRPILCRVACWTNLHLSGVVAGSLEVFASQWDWLSLKGGWGKTRGETEGGRAALNAEPLLYWRGEERRGDSMWSDRDECLFLERWIISQQHCVCVCVCMRARVCYCLSGSQGDVARCLPHITEFTKRAVCTERDQSWKDGEYLNRLEGKGAKNKNSTKQNLIIRI